MNKANRDPNEKKSKTKTIIKVVNAIDFKVTFLYVANITFQWSIMSNCARVQSKMAHQKKDKHLINGKFYVYIAFVCT